MAEVKVVVNGRSYAIACDDGEEAHLTELAGVIDQRVADLAAGLGQIGEGRLLLMASLLIADELAEAKDQAASSDSAAKQSSQRVAAAAHKDTMAATEAMMGAAAELEDIAARLENA